MRDPNQELKVEAAECCKGAFNRLLIVLLVVGGIVSLWDLLLWDERVGYAILVLGFPFAMCYLYEYRVMEARQRAEYRHLAVLEGWSEWRQVTALTRNRITEGCTDDPTSVVFIKDRT